MNIGDNLKTLRQQLKLSQEEMGNQTGLSRSIITNIEYNRAEINPRYLEQICKTYHVNRVWLETGEGDMFEERSREEQVASAIGKWMSEPEQNDFKIKLIGYLTEMSEDEWQLLYNMAKKLTDK